MIGLGHALSLALAPQEVVTPPFVGALDGFTEGLTECWSHRRKLVSSHSGTLLQGRRTSDDEPMDVPALSNGELDDAALLSFAGGSSVAVAALRGQLSGIDFIQPAADDQRIIVDGGNLVTVGGKAASRGLRDGVDSPEGGGMFTNAFSTYTGTSMSIFLRGRHDSYTGSYWFSAIVDAYFGVFNDSISAVRVLYHGHGTEHPGITWVGDFNGTFNADYLISVIFDGTAATFRDGTNTYILPTSGAFNFNHFLLGYMVDNTTKGYSSSLNKMQEAAVWHSDQTVNEAAIRAALLA